MDDGDFNYRDSTFPTGIDSSIEPENDDTLRLPDVVNFVALRETCLSEAPFVKRGNRKFWKKWMDSSQYITILCATLKILLGCINENGNIDAQGLYVVQGNPLMDQMSMCIAEMLVMDRKRFSRAHDNLFKRLPELLCYMLVNSLHSCNPRQARIFNSVKFRELLLDWLSELIGGIRLTNCQTDRRWLFLDTNDTPVNILNNNFLSTLIPKTAAYAQRPNTTSGHLTRANTAGTATTHLSLEESERSANTPASASAGSSTANSNRTHSRMPPTGLPPINTATQPNSNNHNISPAGSVTSGSVVASNGIVVRHSGGNIANKGGSTCHFSVGNSPLVSIYMNLGRSSADHMYTCAHPVKLILTTQPDRPLTSMTPDSLLKASAFREKIIEPDQFRKALKTASVNRRQILKQDESQQLGLKRDIVRANQALRIQYALLENKTVDVKKHILASSSFDTLKLNNNNNNGAGSNSSVGGSEKNSFN